MSKIGKLLIKLPENTTLTMEGNNAIVKGKLGELQWKLPDGINVAQENNVITVTNSTPKNQILKALYGLTRAKLANMVKGVSEGFEITLEITGVGFRGELHDNELWLHIGLSHPVKMPILPGVIIKVSKSDMVISGIDREIVGEMAARIRAMKKPEPYKGKGIKYQGEIIQRKQGKAAKASAS